MFIPKTWSYVFIQQFLGYRKIYPDEDVLLSLSEVKLADLSSSKHTFKMLELGKVFTTLFLENVVKVSDNDTEEYLLFLSIWMADSYALGSSSETFFEPFPRQLILGKGIKYNPQFLYLAQL